MLSSRAILTALWLSTGMSFGSRSDLCHFILASFSGVRTLLSCFAHDTVSSRDLETQLVISLRALKNPSSAMIIHVQVGEPGEEAVVLGMSPCKDKKVGKGKIDWLSEFLGSSDCFTSIRAQGPGGHVVHKDDVVEYLQYDGSSSVGRVMYHMRHGSTWMTVLCPWQRVHGTKFKVQHDPAVILLSSVVQCCMYSLKNDNAAHEHCVPCERGSCLSILRTSIMFVKIAWLFS